MITINLKDFYPWYGTDEFIEVPEEVVWEMLADKRYEAAYTKKIKRHKVLSFSDYGDKTQEWCNQSAPDPQHMAEIRELLEQFLEILAVLPEIQSRRIRAHIILEMTLSETATTEQVSVAAVHKPIRRGLEKTRKTLTNRVEKRPFSVLIHERVIPSHV